jgi:hypothetical protein
MGKTRSNSVTWVLAVLFSPYWSTLELFVGYSSPIPWCPSSPAIGGRLDGLAYNP